MVFNWTFQCIKELLHRDSNELVSLSLNQFETCPNKLIHLNESDFSNTTSKRGWFSVIYDYLARSLSGCVRNATQKLKNMNLLFTGKRSYLWERCTVLSFFHSIEKCYVKSIAVLVSYLKKPPYSDALTVGQDLFSSSLYQESKLVLWKA